MLNEPEPVVLRAMARSLYLNYLAPSALRPLGCFHHEVTGQREPLLRRVDDAVAFLGSMAPSQLRHLFDGAYYRCLTHVQHACFEAFLQSLHYQYVLHLSARALLTPSADDFAIHRLLGVGAFGRVLLVTKRDCGTQYAMKVQRKEDLAGGSPLFWEEMAVRELHIMKSLHHPLLVRRARERMRRARERMRRARERMRMGGADAPREGERMRAGVCWR